MSSLTQVSAREDFREARRRAGLQQVLANLRGESAELLPFDAIRHNIRADDTTDLGLQEIPLDAIVGSVGRYKDFTRSFLPRSDKDEERWTRVKAQIERSGMTPIRVYQVGAVFFVIDGNHRVSIARQMNNESIPAYVTDVETRVHLSLGDSPDEIIRKARYASFLEVTDLDTLRPEANLMMTVPGHYQVLLDQIQAKHYLMALDPRREVVTNEDAVIAWYDRVYRPMLGLIQQQGMSRHFPELTETDLYVLVLKHREELRKDLDWNVDTVAVAADLTKRKSRQRGQVVDRVSKQVFHAVTPEALEGGPATGSWRERRLARRPGESVFAEILVAGRGVAADFNMIRHAGLVARRENGRLLALRVVADETETATDSVRENKIEFERYCRDAGIPGELAIEKGRVARTIIARTAWVDLLVLSLVRRSGPKTETGFGTNFNKILQGSPRPVLVVPEGADSDMDRVLLAYDGSGKADEALYLSAYLARNWHVSVTVLAAGNKRAEAALQQARAYLTSREVQATYVQGDRPAAGAILETANSRACNLILMGGFGHRPALQVMVGSTVDKVLQAIEQPVLICR